MKKKLINQSWSTSVGLTRTLRIMKLTILIFFVALLQLPASTYSQNTRLKVVGNNLSLEEIFDMIEHQSDFSFFYNISQLDRSKRLNMNENNEFVEKILNNVLSGTELTYTITNKLIVIHKPNEEASAVIQQVVQGKKITGKVTDSSGATLPGVSVVVKGTTIGVITDLGGKYSISNIPGNATLQFSFVGMKTQEVVIGNKSSVDAVLIEADIAVEEVVVIGYGVSSRKDVTGSISSIKLENSPQSLLPNNNALEALRGEVSGVNVGVVTTAGGEPSLDIRGQNSINGSNAPLIVLDGVIFTGAISDINPGDIANYDILKDAVSCAVYGSRSANGVIAITTKKGKMGKPIITFNTSAVFERFQNKPNLMKGLDYLKTYNDKLKQPGTSTINLTQPEVDNYNNGIETDWLDLIVRTGVVQDYQLAVSGATDKANYYLSASYDKNSGVIKGDDFNRISVMSKLSMKITNWLKIGYDASYTKKDYSGYNASYSNALVLPPYTTPYRDDQGNLEKYPRTNSFVNPLWGINDGTRENININNFFMLNSYVIVDCPWIKGLSYRLNFQNSLQKREIGTFNHESYFVNEGVGTVRYEPGEIQKQLVNASGSSENANITGYIIDNILNFKQVFGKHHFDATLVATRDKESYYSVTVNGSDYRENGNTSLGIWGISKATTLTSGMEAYIKTNIGYLGRLNYNFGEKYYVSGSVRRDGASVFGANKKWGTFSAIGFAWNISNEDFFKKSKTINNLKLRLSWGQNGNQGIGPYSTLSTVLNGFNANTFYEFSDMPGAVNYGLYQNILGNPSLGWETTESLNTGFESAWFNNRISLDLDIYYSKTTDQLFDRKISAMTGFKTMKASLGQIDNKGIEINLKTVNIKTGDWNWASSFIFWKNSNKLAHLYGEDLNNDGLEDDDIASSLFIGKSLGAIYGYVQDGIVQATDLDYIAMTKATPGDAKFKDIDAIKGISTSDRTILGYSKPNFKLGFSNTLTYKGLTLYARFTGTFGSKNYFLASNVKAFSSATPDRSSSNGIYLPYWTSGNTSNIYPAVTYNPDGRYLALQSRSFLKLQSVSLSYTLRKSMVNLLGLNSMRVFLTAENLFTITNWSGGDPEAGIGVGSSVFPVTTNYSIGINMSF